MVCKSSLNSFIYPIGTSPRRRVGITSLGHPRAPNLPLSKTRPSGADEPGSDVDASLGIEDRV